MDARIGRQLPHHDAPGPLLVHGEVPRDEVFAHAHVVVEKDNHGAHGPEHPILSRHGDAGVLLAQHRHLKRVGEGSDDRGGVLVGPVVDHDDLELFAAERLPREALQQTSQRRLAVVGGDNDRSAHARRLAHVRRARVLRARVDRGGTLGLHVLHSTDSTQSSNARATQNTGGPIKARGRPR